MCSPTAPSLVLYCLLLSRGLAITSGSYPSKACGAPWRASDGREKVNVQSRLAAAVRGARVGLLHQLDSGIRWRSTTAAAQQQAAAASSALAEAVLINTAVFGPDVDSLVTPVD